MTELLKARCKVCVFWEMGDDLSPSTGNCHRLAPGLTGGAFPIIHGNEWCGEFVVSDEAEQQEVERRKKEAMNKFI